MSTQSRSNHTPLPWRIGDAGLTVFGPKTDAPSPKTVAHSNRADAAHIVRCVNSHEALTEALERVVQFMHSALAGTIHDDDLQHYEAIARAALEQAGGAQ